MFKKFAEFILVVIFMFIVMSVVVNAEEIVVEEAYDEVIVHEEEVTIIDKEAYTEIIEDGTEIVVDGEMDFTQADEESAKGYATIYTRNSNAIVYEDGTTQYEHDDYTYVGYALIDEEEVWESDLVYDEENDQFLPSEDCEKHIIKAWDLDGNELNGLNAYVIKDHCGNSNNIYLNDGTYIGNDHSWHIDCVYTPFILKISSDLVIEHEEESHVETITWEETIHHDAVVEYVPDPEPVVEEEIVEIVPDPEPIVEEMLYDECSNSNIITGGEVPYIPQHDIVPEDTEVPQTGDNSIIVVIVVISIFIFAYFVPNFLKRR